ncbi:MAG TPA: sucrase ferredoxin [Pyrinomonadaceae bacterium]|nr:sucrase ferredoxin [Pyrinomonadaceae bacterium]
MTSPTPFYCAQASLDAGEMCFGTAVNADIWLLVENSEPWGRNAVKDSSMPEAVKDHLASLSRTSRRIRVQLIKQESRTKFPRQVYVAFTRQIGAYLLSSKIASYEDLLQITADDLLERKFVLAHDGAVHEPIHLVCTHGVHDKCCAKFGFATYKFMREIAGDGVWQTSHVGGDRFASNVISFPSGVYYGHVDDDSARAIVEAESNKRIYLERYRGRTCFGTHGQVAEYFVRRESGISEIKALSREWVRPQEGHARWTGLFTSADGGREYTVSFEQVRSSFRSRLTCHAAEEKSPFEYRLLGYSESTAPSED